MNPLVFLFLFSREKKSIPKTDPSTSGMEQGQGWERPALPQWDVQKKSLILQQFEVDYTLSEPIRGMPGLQAGPVPIIRMFGATGEGYRYFLFETTIFQYSFSFSLTH